MVEREKKWTTKRLDKIIAQFVFTRSENSVFVAFLHRFFHRSDDVMQWQNDWILRNYYHATTNHTKNCIKNDLLRWFSCNVWLWKWLIFAEIDAQVNQKRDDLLNRRFLIRISLNCSWKVFEINEYLYLQSLTLIAYWIEWQVIFRLAFRFALI